jgi:hypothetical protein
MRFTAVAVRRQVLPAYKGSVIVIMPATDCGNNMMSLLSDPNPTYYRCLSTNPNMKIERTIPLLKRCGSMEEVVERYHTCYLCQDCVDYKKYVGRTFC